MAKKLYYKIGEACKILEIQPYVLRYWETEFPFLNPSKSKSGQRVYSGREIDVIRRIKELLYEEGYTIAGAKKKLESEIVGEDESVTEPAADAKTDGGNSGQDAARPPSSEDREAARKVAELRVGVEGALRQAQKILAALQS